MRRVRLLAIWLNVAVPGVLVALAYATPPDPTYLGGLWDDADYDDVVILVTSAVGSIDTHAERDLTRLLVVIAQIWPGEEEPQVASFSLHSPRAPPVVSAARSRGGLT